MTIEQAKQLLIERYEALEHWRSLNKNTDVKSSHIPWLENEIEMLEQYIKDKRRLEMKDKLKWERNINATNIGTELNDALFYRNNKDVAYTEGLKEFKETAIKKTINGEVYYLHPNINMYLDITPACTCDCGFCIAKTEFDRTRISEEKYIALLENALKMTRHIDASIQVTGGEPTISPIFFNVLDLIDKYKFKRPVLNTNGANLSEDVVSRLNKSTFEHINISRHHYNDYTNDEIMNPEIKRTSDDLEASIKNLNIPVRVQCNLIGDYIDTYGEVMQFIAYAYHKIGCSNVVFSQLTPLPKGTMYKQGIIDYVKQRQVDIDSILNKIGNDNRFRFVKYRGGVACYYEVWEYTAYEKPMTVLFKFSDNQYLEVADSYDKYLPDLIFHTDGTLCGSWNRNTKILIDNSI